jgi:hypothetical protein
VTEYPRPPANIEPYVRALGLERAVAFLLAFGGAPGYFSARPTAGSKIAEVIGADGVQALAETLGKGQWKIPTAKPWIAQVRDAQGVSIFAIARELHVVEDTARKWVHRGRKAARDGAPETRQMSLF